MEKTGFFEVSPGNKSSSRLIAFLVISFALILTSILICSVSWIAIENKETDGLLGSLTGIGVFFTTMAGSVLVWMFNQKKNEEKQLDS